MPNALDSPHCLHCRPALWSHPSVPISYFSVSVSCDILLLSLCPRLGPVPFWTNCFYICFLLAVWEESICLSNPFYMGPCTHCGLSEWLRWVPGRASESPSVPGTWVDVWCLQEIISCTFPAPGWLLTLSLGFQGNAPPSWGTECPSMVYVSAQAQSPGM